RGWSVASQVLLGRLHRCNGVGRLTLCIRELLDVVFQHVELTPQAIDFLVLRGALRVPLRRGGRWQLEPPSPVRSRPRQGEVTDAARTKRYPDERYQPQPPPFRAQNSGGVLSELLVEHIEPWHFRRVQPTRHRRFRCQLAFTCRALRCTPWSAHFRTSARQRVP